MGFNNYQLYYFLPFFTFRCCSANRDEKGLAKRHGLINRKINQACTWSIDLDITPTGRSKGYKEL
ncbi:hypothetical protein HanIR_Chr10g0501621 [Helianthus annuus]|nr:hypothetical protein HanIR_Chr10g0501621 [Helianthus annuus]